MKFPWQKSKNLLSDEDNRLIVKAIRQAEETTSGEVRVYIEKRCSWMDALDRAAEIFYLLKMEKTKDRNAVLIYVAIKDHQVAIFGDQGIHNIVGTPYWNSRVEEMLNGFKNNTYGKAIAESVVQVGDALHKYFPYNKSTDKNELPDEIVFGR